MKTEPNAPVNAIHHVTKGQSTDSGLSKREHFAAIAMQGILSNQHMGGNGYSFVEIAKWSIDHADALIEALNSQYQ